MKEHFLRVLLPGSFACFFFLFFTGYVQAQTPGNGNTTSTIEVRVSPSAPIANAVALPVGKNKNVILFNTKAKDGTFDPEKSSIQSQSPPIQTSVIWSISLTTDTQFSVQTIPLSPDHSPWVRCVGEFKSSSPVNLGTGKPEVPKNKAWYSKLFRKGLTHVFIVNHYDEIENWVPMGYDSTADKSALSLIRSRLMNSRGLDLKDASKAILILCGPKAQEWKDLNESIKLLKLQKGQLSVHRLPQYSPDSVKKILDAIPNDEKIGSVFTIGHGLKRVIAGNRFACVLVHYHKKRKACADECDGNGFVANTIDDHKDLSIFQQLKNQNPGTHYFLMKDFIHSFSGKIVPDSFELNLAHCDTATQFHQGLDSDRKTRLANCAAIHLREKGSGVVLGYQGSFAGTTDELSPIMVDANTLLFVRSYDEKK